MSNSPSTTTGRRAGARRGSLARSSDRARTTRARGRRGASDRGRGRAGAWTRRAGRRSVTSPRRGRRTDFERAAPHLHFLFSSGSARWREFFSRRGRTRTRGEWVLGNVALESSFVRTYVRSFVRSLQSRIVVFVLSWFSSILLSPSLLSPSPPPRGAARNTPEA